MSKQYISTAVVGDAHKSDILDVAITKQFTITCSADGFLKMWTNDSADKALKYEQLVDKLGLHHVTVFEDIIKEQSILLISTISFSGKCYVYKYDNRSNTLNTLTGLPQELENSKTSFWANKFAKDPLGESNLFASTLTSGQTQVYDLSFPSGANNTEEEILKMAPIFRYRGSTPSKENSFATTIDIDPVKKRIAVGHQNGTVYLFDTEYLKPLYEFESYGLKKSTASSSLSTVRSIKFSPAGKLLAVARDSGSYGTITLYDVKYGETIGSLTSATHSSNVGIGGYAHDNWCLTVSFNDEGTLLASGGLDDKIRVWNVETKQREATIGISKTDVSNDVLDNSNQLDNATCCSLSFIKKGLIRGEGDNDGLVVVGFDRAIRWYREAGGI